MLKTFFFCFKTKLLIYIDSYSKCLADTFRCDPSSVACQSPLWTKMTYSVARHFQVQDKVSSDIVCKDVGCCQTFSGIKLKDIVSCEIFAVVRHLQLSRHLLLWDTFCFETLAVVRHFTLKSKKTLSVTRYFQLSDIFSCQTLSVVKHFPLKVVLRNVSGN